VRHEAASDFTAVAVLGGVGMIGSLHKDIHGTNGAKKRDIATAEVDEISDPQALVCVYREFGGGSQSDQMILIQVLGQIDKPVSSEILALLSRLANDPALAV
jgi:hypothetical protein